MYVAAACVLVPYNWVVCTINSVVRGQVVEPFDKTLCKEIEKAIATSGLNLTPNNDGNIIRINIPPLTEDRRKELAKQVSCNRLRTGGCVT